jgi:plastocyanin domain-containing protein
MTDLVVNLGGVALIGLIVWWFWLAGSSTKVLTSLGRPVEITVEDGVYTPARIEVPVGKPVTLRFLRKDPSPCAEQVVFADLNVSGDLPLGKPRDITLTPVETGELAFTCQMGMYRGVLSVK